MEELSFGLEEMNVDWVESDGKGLVEADVCVDHSRAWLSNFASSSGSVIGRGVGAGHSAYSKPPMHAVPSGFRKIFSRQRLRWARAGRPRVPARSKERVEMPNRYSKRLIPEDCIQETVKAK